MPGDLKQESHYNPGVLERLRARWVGYPAAVLVVLATIGLLKLFPGLTDSSVALLLLLASFSRLGLAERAGSAGGGSRDARVQLLLPSSALHVHDRGSAQRRGALRLPRLGPPDRQALGALPAPPASSSRRSARDLIALTQLSQGFLSDTNRESLLGVAADRLRQALGAEQVAILIADDERGALEADRDRERRSARTSRSSPSGRATRRRSRRSSAARTSICRSPSACSARASSSRAGCGRASAWPRPARLLLGLAVERERFLRLTRAAEETQTSEQMKSTLLAPLAHDLKTPVAAARAARSRTGRPQAAAPRAPRLAREQLTGLSRRVTELMDVVRLDSGLREPRRERVTAERSSRPPSPGSASRSRTHSLFLEPPPPDVPRRGRPGPADRGSRARSRERRAVLPRGDRRFTSRSSPSGRSSSCVSRTRGAASRRPIANACFERFVRLDDGAACREAGSACSSPAASSR